MKLRIEHGGECRTYAMLRHVAWHLLEVAKVEEKGSLLQLKASAVFHAFTFEAYLNHVGVQEIPYWDDIERIPYRKKLSVIAKHLEFEFDSGLRPFQTIRTLFDLRDSLAHGRTIEIEEAYETFKMPSENSTWCILPWERLNIEIVQRFSDDLDASIETINQARSTPDQALWNQGMRNKSVTVISPEK